MCAMKRRRTRCVEARIGRGLVILFLIAPVALAQDSKQGSSERVADSTQSTRSSIPTGLRFANALLNEQRYDRAVEEFERFLATAPAREDRADALYGLSRAQLFQRRYPEARESLELFLKLAPEHPSAASALFRLGEAAYLMRDLRAARQALDRFIEAYPTHPQQQVAWPYLGFTRFELNELEPAQQALERALQDYPTSPLADRARYTLARVLAARNQPDKAVEHLSALASRSGSEWADRAAVQIGQVQLGAGRADQALETFQRLERTLPAGAAQADVRMRAAEALVQLKRSAEAEAVLQSIIETRGLPTVLTSQAALSLGAIQMERDDAARAFATWDRALASATGTTQLPALQFRAAEALEKLGRKSEARVRFQSLVAEHPSDEWADEALASAARLALEERDYAAARSLVADFNKRYAESSMRDEARLIDARATQLSGNDKLAIELLERLLATENLAPETRQSALHFLSQAYKATNQVARANEILAELARSPATPLAANARFTLGQSLFDAGKFGESIQAFDAYLQDHPKDDLTPHALAFLALANHELKRDAEAETALTRLAAEWPDSEPLTRVRLRLGEAALDAKNYDAAIPLLTAAASSAGDWAARAQVDLGWALIGAGKPAAAAAAFAACVAQSPNAAEAPEAAFLRGWALEKADSTAEAIQAYSQCEGQFAERPEAVKARLARARLATRAGHFDDSIAAYKKLIADDRDRLPETESLDQLLGELAAAYLGAGSTKESEAVFEKLLTDFPDRPTAQTARLYLAEAAYRDHQLERARELLDPVVSGATASSIDASIMERAYFRLGRVALDQSKLDEAARLFASLVETFPTGALRDEARFWQAETLYRDSKPRDAEPIFAQLSTASDPAASTSNWRDSARLRRLQCLVALSRWNDVLTQADQFLVDRPEFPQVAEVHYARGRALASQPPPRFQEARTAYQRAIEAAPQSEAAARAQFMRGETFLHEKDYRAAIREFQQVELLYENSKLQASSLLESGKAYEALDQRDDAQACYRKIVERFPDDPSAAEANRRLKP